MGTGYDNKTEQLLQKLEQRFPLDIRKQIEFVDNTLATSDGILPTETQQAWQKVKEVLWQRVTQMQDDGTGTAVMQKRIDELSTIIEEMRKQQSDTDTLVDDILKKLSAQDTLVMLLSARVLEADNPNDAKQLEAIANTPTTMRIGRDKTAVHVTVHDRCKAFASFMGLNGRIINQDSTARLMQLFSGIPYNTLKGQFSPQSLAKPYSSPEVEQWINNEFNKQA